jgi:hypothetical protein
MKDPFTTVKTLASDVQQDRDYDIRPANRLVQKIQGN